MTEEAIKSALKYLVHKQQEQGSWGYADNDNINKVPWDEALEWIDQQPCGDCISRKAVIDTIFAECSGVKLDIDFAKVLLLQRAIKYLPPVIPQPKTCGDCISRQAVNKLVDELARAISDEKCHIQRGRNYGRIMHDILELPSVEPEKCEDCISREGTIKSIENMKRFQQDTDDICEMIQNLPSVTPSYNSIKTELISSEDCISRQKVLDLAKSGRLVSNGNYKSVCDAINGLPSVEMEKCGDCISRIDILKKLNNLCNNICEYSKKQRKSMCDACNLGFAFDMINNAKSVEPERKTGKWKHMVGWWECDQCHAEYTDMPTCMGKVIYEYCPMCGCRMKEVEE